MEMARGREKERENAWNAQHLDAATKRQMVEHFLRENISSNPLFNLICIFIQSEQKNQKQQEQTLNAKIMHAYELQNDCNGAVFSVTFAGFTQNQLMRSDSWFHYFSRKIFVRN